MECVLSNFDGTNAFVATRRDLLISTSQKAASEKDRMFAADSLLHGSMTLQARDGPVTLMANSGRRWVSLAPRDFNDCFYPKMDQWRQHLRTVDCTNSWLDAINPCAPMRRTVGLSCATFMDDISRVQIFAAPPSVAEVVFKMNRANSFLEESLSWNQDIARTWTTFCWGRCGVLSGGTSRHTWKGIRQKQTKEVFRSWSLLQAAEESQVRRVRWYQSWARHPKDHAVVAAVLGTCKAEEIVGVQRLTSEGNVCQTSTPMARQMADDLFKVSQTSEEVVTWYGQRRSDVAVFTPGCWERARFLDLLVEELREAKLAYRCRKAEESQTGGLDGRLIELEEPFVCTEPEGDETYNKRFANYRQLMAHKTRKLVVGTVLGLLTRTNECPWCNSRFVDRETALHHLYSATETKGKC